MKKEFRGADGEVGSVNYWFGNKEVVVANKKLPRVLTVNTSKANGVL